MKNNIINHISLSFDAISENEAFARMTVAFFMAQLNPTIDQVEDVKTAVSEAVTNAIIHGYEVFEDEAAIQHELCTHECIDKPKNHEIHETETNRKNVGICSYHALIHANEIHGSEDSRCHSAYQCRWQDEDIDLHIR